MVRKKISFCVFWGEENVLKGPTELSFKPYDLIIARAYLNEKFDYFPKEHYNVLLETNIDFMQNPSQYCI